LLSVFAGNLFNGISLKVKLNFMKTIINTTNAPAPIGPYSQAVVAGGFLFASGQVAINPESGELNMSSIAEETHQVMRNIKAVLIEANYEFAHIIKTTIFLSDMSLFAQVNEVYGAYFSSAFPARETVAVKGLPKGVNVEISITAYKA
jgi:2-iminobutanoate/2-iminopropanoate deaminase